MKKGLSSQLGVAGVFILFGLLGIFYQVHQETKRQKEMTTTAMQSELGSAMDTPSPAVDKPITGTVSLDPKLKNAWPKKFVIFLVAKGPEGGPPAAVKRLTEKPPFSFILSSADAMIPGSPLQGPLRLTVRVDQDGDAVTRTPGDLLGAAEKEVQPGDSIAITISEKF